MTGPAVTAGDWKKKSFPIQPDTTEPLTPDDKQPILRIILLFWYYETNTINDKCGVSFSLRRHPPAATQRSSAGVCNLYGYEGFSAIPAHYLFDFVQLKVSENGRKLTIK